MMRRDERVFLSVVAAAAAAAAVVVVIYMPLVVAIQLYGQVDLLTLPSRCSWWYCAHCLRRGDWGLYH